MAMKHRVAPSFVDLGTEFEGRHLRSAIWDLFKGYTPDDVREMFEELFADIAVSHGWAQDADGNWFRPYLR